MRFTSNPHRWTYLTGAVFLGSLLWMSAFHQPMSVFLTAFSSFCFVASALISVAVGLAKRTRPALYRIFINLLVFALIFPVISVGVYIRDGLFRSQLPRFQEAADQLIRTARDGNKGDVFTASLPLPADYKTLLVLDTVQVKSEPNNISVRFTNPDASALSHSGYLYRSDDSISALKKESPDMGVSQLAPHWFYFIK